MFPLVTTKLESGVLPTAPDRVTFPFVAATPAAFNVSPKAPLTVLEKLIAEFAVVTPVVPSSVTGPVNPMFPALPPEAVDV